MRKAMTYGMAALMVLMAFTMMPPAVLGADGSPTIDGTLGPGEWDDYFWFTDNSKGPGTGYDDDDVPIFTGYMTFDDENLYLAFDVQDDTPSTNLDFLYLTIDIPPAGEFNNDFFANTFVMDDWTWHYIPVDALYWGSIPANPSFFGAAYETGGSFPWDRSQGASDWGTVGGVVTARTIIGTNRYYELKIPLAAIVKGRVGFPGVWSARCPRPFPPTCCVETPPFLQ